MLLVMSRHFYSSSECVLWANNTTALGTGDMAYWIKQKWLEFASYPMHISCFTEEA